MSDSVQLQRKQQEQQVDQLRRELDDMKALHEKRLRSLRQEHERIKVQYESVLKDLEQYQGSTLSHVTGNASGAGLGGLTKGSASAVNSIRTLSQALNKIR